MGGLTGDYVRFPGSGEEWNKVAKRFSSRWNNPNCVGAIDGKHVNNYSGSVESRIDILSL